MAPGNTVTLVGNITRDPELRFTKSGRAVSGFGLAVNRRWFNNQINDWEEEVDFFDVTCWSELAENVVDTLAKGDRVIVDGRLDQQTWEDEDEKKHSRIEVIADDVGPSLRWASAEITKNEKKSSGSRSESRGRDRGDRGDRSSGGNSRRRSEPDYDEEPF